jgi:cytochrome c oxidase subunit 4
MSDERDWHRAVRRLGAAWLGLLLLLAASLGSAYIPLGIGNFVAGIAIAAIKTGIVVVVFMQLPGALPATRIAAAMGVAVLLVLAALSGVDYATRRVEPAAWQSPQQLPPAVGPGAGR